MNKSIVRCRCGHQVLSKEVLRTDLYERRAPGDSSRDYVYVKYRCRRCKRMGETFVAENIWDWAMLEAESNEMTEQERDRFLDEEIVTAEDILDFHRDLETFSLSDLKAMTLETPDVSTETAVEPTAETETRASPVASEFHADAATASAATDVAPPESVKNDKPIPRAPRPPDEPRSDEPRNETSNESRSKHT